MRNRKVTLGKAELEALCLSALKERLAFADTLGVEVTRMLGSPSGGWTIRRLLRARGLCRPRGRIWNHVGHPILEELRRNCELEL